MRLPRSFRREFLLLGGSTILLQGARFGYSLAVAGSAPAPTLTMWALLLAAMAYAPAMLLGVLNGMNREVPYLVGARRLTEANAAEATTWMTFGVVACVMVMASAAALLLGSPVQEIVAVGTALLATIVFQLQQMAMRSRLAFHLASFQQTTFGVLTLAAGVVLVLRGLTSFAEVAFAYTAALTAACAVGAIAQAPALRGASFPVWRRLLQVGFPIMAAGAFYTLFVTSDRWVATWLLGSEGAAPYALASLIGSAMLVVPTVISQQTYPRMAMAYGGGRNADGILAMAKGQSTTAFALTAPLAVLGAAAIAIVIPRLLPAYSDSVGPAIIVLFGLAPLAASSGFGNYLNVIGRQWTFVAVQLVSLAVGIALMALGAGAFGLIGIAIGAAMASLVYASLLAAVATRGIPQDTASDTHSGSDLLTSPPADEM